MELRIDTSNNEYISLALHEDKTLLAENRIEAKYRQSEKLLVAIEGLLKESGRELGEVKSIRVNEKGEGFSALRIGVVTANALAYALGVPVSGIGVAAEKVGDVEFVKPEYSKEPNIGK